MERKSFGWSPSNILLLVKNYGEWNIYFRLFINRRYLELIHVVSVSHLKCDTEIEIKIDLTFIQMTHIDDSSLLSHLSHRVMVKLEAICCSHWSDGLTRKESAFFLFYTTILKPDFDLENKLFSRKRFSKNFWKNFWKKFLKFFHFTF